MGPQPEMNFTRIHRLRESYQRQEIQQKENKKLQAQNTLDDGAMKLERLKSAKNRDRNNSRPPLKGVENTAFVGEAGETGTMKTDESVEQGIQDMLTSLNQVSQHVSDEDLIDEMIFIKRLLQDDSFKQALNMHHTLITSTTSKSSKNLPLCPDTLYLKSIASHVEKELEFCHLDSASELNQILRQPIMQAVMETHDVVAQTAVTASKNMSFFLLDTPHAVPHAPHHGQGIENTSEEQDINNRVSQLTDKTVRIVTINKTAEALQQRLFWRINTFN